ncbi:glycosyltransferase [Vibrio sp. 404]|uniref:Glycosyltransferase n=1 Tax=Vibrio marinisediminis TaxID=2758441 RepID=A0A7W2FTA3_9VIBR|nr:glycosyltransferase [Vibrio marinisediminis]MBA5763774.1 glycosyltransferase [Vibrio marinisediminis]
MKYSVIVPIYNTFDYAKTIVDWFLLELAMRPEKDIELVLVDDGSKNGPSYHIESSAIRLIRKENGGVSSARNFGIEHAKGDYILFLDSDDSYESGIFTYLDEVFASDSRLNSILLSFRKLRDGAVDQVLNAEQNVTGREALSQFLTKNIRLHICGLVVSRSCLNEHNLRFDEALHFSEDVLFIIEYLAIAQHCFISSVSLYNHIMRSGSAINSPLTDKDTTHIDAFERISSLAKNNAVEEDVNFFISTCYINLIKFLVKNKTADEAVFNKIINNSHFLFNKMSPTLSKYTVIVYATRLLFKIDGLCNYRVLRKLSFMGQV